MGAMEIIILLALAAVICAMLLGLYSMHGGGPFDKEHSVQFMYLRVGLQGAAVVLMLAALWFGRG